MQVDWQDAQADIILFVRSEAAGMVTGKQGAQYQFSCSSSDTQDSKVQNARRLNYPCKILQNVDHPTCWEVLS